MFECNCCGHCIRCNFGLWPNWSCQCGSCKWCLQRKLAYNRKTMAGESISLRALVIDELHERLPASGVTVSIYPPQTTVFIPANATVVSGVPVYRGDGIYQYDYSVPNNAPAGVWIDMWQGTLPYQTVSGMCTFLVDNQAYISSFGAQLYQNNIVEVCIASGLHGTDGSTMMDSFFFDFVTTACPAYSDVRKMRLEIGAFIQDLNDDILEEGILEASIQANAMTFSPIVYNSPLFIHARREYTTWVAIRILLDNISRGMGVRGKSLGDFAVQYDPQMLLRLMDKADERITRWEGEVIAAGGMRQVQMPKYSVKGELDPDRVKVGRLWQTDQHGNLSQRIPAANSRMKTVGNRRYHSTYRPYLTVPGWKKGW